MIPGLASAIMITVAFTNTRYHESIFDSEIRFLIVPRMMAPRTEPISEPEPPAIDVPPKMAAVIAVSVISAPLTAEPEPVRSV